MRNVFFEPTLYPSDDLIKKTIWRIEEAFKLNKPAIICSHRLNFVGNMCKDNRDRNLALLSELLKAISEQWPDVEYMSTMELGKVMADEL
ncbi:MAG: hypothetical protein U5K69_19005 [Balneolaceae bacterium]|nr:hypothetical protein [Balneolaceae bacterium]